MTGSAGTRCILFIDGNNWHHGLKALEIDSGRLDYRKVADKLLQGRKLEQIRYYVGKISGNLKWQHDQERFLGRLSSQGIEIGLGRIERNKLSPDSNPVVPKLEALLDDVRDSLPKDAIRRFEALCNEPFIRLYGKAGGCEHRCGHGCDGLSKRIRHRVFALSRWRFRSRSRSSAASE